MYSFKFTRIFVALAISVFFKISSGYASVPVSGKICDSQTGIPLAGANILIEELNTGTTSDNQGHFRINLQPGKYTFSASYIGYRIRKKAVTVSGESFVLDFNLTPQVLEGQKVIVSATRAKERETPVVFTDLSRQELAAKHPTQEIPMLLTEIPGIYSYSDAGNGLGYSYLKIRGFDQTRVAVMLNGIPLNDPEDHQVYWVDMPDFLASVQDIQIQRGVGASVYGSSSFGGTVNLITNELNSAQRISLNSGFGSYDTRKISLSFNSGLIDNRYAVAGRFSKILSDGYRENSDVDLWAYFLSASRYGLHTTTKINFYGGPELTHAAWEASPESELKKNHRHNPIKFLNTIDSFHQPHYELLHEWEINPKLTLANTLFYIHGKGYYEGLKTDARLLDFGYQPFYLADSNLISRTDLVRQKWVEKDQIGWIVRLDWEHTRGTLSVGMDVYDFRSDHWGLVTWAAQLPPASVAGNPYHRYSGKKQQGTFYIHEIYRFAPKWSLMLDGNIQMQQYAFAQQEVGNFQGVRRHAYDVSYLFLNPRLGINYNLSDKLNLFATGAMAHREPADTDLFNIWQGPDDLNALPLFKKWELIYKTNGQVDYIKWEDPLVKPEELLDYELGFGYRNHWLELKGNLYWMNFRNEIVPYSQVDDDGFPIKGNADRTVHRGFETAIILSLPAGLSLTGNLSASQNYFARFQQYQEMYDADWNFIGSRAVDFSNKTITGFPGLMANAKIGYQRGPILLALQAQHVGKQYLDNTENESRVISAHSLLHFQAALQLPQVWGFPAFRVSLFVNNMLDKSYETAGYYDSWAGENYYWPGAGRNFFFNLETSL